MSVTLDPSNNGSEVSEGTPVPSLLSDRSTDPKRLLHAARGLACLESDLRELLKRGAIDDSTLVSAANSYRAMRSDIISILDEGGAADAADGVIGMPDIGFGKPTFGSLLLSISQATRFMGVEEGWPGLYVRLLDARSQLDQRLKSADAGGTTPVPGIGRLGSFDLGSSGPGYL